jgi:hypothetical protein
VGQLREPRQAEDPLVPGFGRGAVGDEDVDMVYALENGCHRRSCSE